MGRDTAFIAVAFLVYALLSSLGSLWGAGNFRPDLVAVFVTYLALFRPSFGGLLLTVAVGWIAGFFSALPFGFFVIEGLCVFGVTRFSTTRLVLRSPRFGALYTAMTALFGQAAFSTVIALFHPSGAVYAKEGLLTLPSVLPITVLAALPLFALLRAIDGRMQPIDRDNYLLGTSRDGYL